MHLYPLTSIRFLFALLVVLFHGLTAAPGRMDGWPKLLVAIVEHGSIGVSFFFVLSGFILTYSYQGRLTGSDTRHKFWWARAARILPAYYLAFLIYLPLALYEIVMSDAPAQGAERGLLVSVLQLSLTQAWVPEAAVAWNGPSWSLSVEAFFYLLFPFLMPKIENRSLRFAMLAAAMAFVLSQILALIVWKLGPETLANSLTHLSGLTTKDVVASALFFTYLPILRVPEFVFGMAIGIIFLKAQPLALQVQKRFVIIGIVGIFAALGWLDGIVPWPAMSNGFLAPFLGLILFGLARSTSIIWTHKFCVLLGEASYSLYLIHIPVLLWCQAIDKKWLHLMDHHFLVFFSAYLVIVIGSSILSYLYLEVPCRRAIMARFALKPKLEAQATAQV